MNIRVSIRKKKNFFRKLDELTVIGATFTYIVTVPSSYKKSSLEKITNFKIQTFNKKICQKFY